MKRYHRAIIALAILLSGLSLVPQISLLAGNFSWQRYVGLYEDFVMVTRARYDDGELEVRASSSSGGAATLQIFVAQTNQYIGTLTFEGDEHRGEFPWPNNPHAITVQSSLGGSSTVLVTDGSGIPPTVTPSVTVTPSRTPTVSVTPTPSPTASATPIPSGYQLYLPIILK